MDLSVMCQQTYLTRLQGAVCQAELVYDFIFLHIAFLD